jgi:hypothetical protein
VHGAPPPADDPLPPRDRRGTPAVDPDATTLPRFPTIQAWLILGNANVPTIIMPAVPGIQWPTVEDLRLAEDPYYVLLARVLHGLRHLR